MLDDLYRLTLRAAAKGLANGDFTAVELTRSLLDRITALDYHIGAYLTVTADLALEQLMLPTDAGRRVKAGRYSDCQWRLKMC